MYDGCNNDQFAPRAKLEVAESNKEQRDQLCLCALDGPGHVRSPVRVTARRVRICGWRFLSVTAISPPPRAAFLREKWLPAASLYATLPTGAYPMSPTRAVARMFELDSDRTRPHRLYFTTFANPVPHPDTLNDELAETGYKPRVRARPRGGPSASPDEGALYYYFTLDDQLLYLSFFQDWGPLNMAMVYKACILIHELLEVRRHCTSCHSRAHNRSRVGGDTTVISTRTICLERPQEKGECRADYGALCGACQYPSRSCSITDLLL